MKITALETVQLPHLNNILWLRVHTDEGLIGLGETFRGADAVARYLHTDVAPLLIGRDPSADRAISKLLTETYVGFRSSGVEMRAASAVDIALWDLFGKAVDRPVHQLLGRPLAAADPNVQHLRRLHLQQARRAALHRRRDEVAEGPYEDQIAFNRDAGALAQSLLEEGITAMKIWPFDPFAVDKRRQLHPHARSRQGAPPVPSDPRRCRRQMEVMVELHSMWDLPSALGDRPRIAGVPPLLGGGSDQDAGSRCPRHLRGAFRASRLRERDASRRARNSSNCCARARPTT